MRIEMNDLIHLNEMHLGDRVEQISSDGRTAHRTVTRLLSGAVIFDNSQNYYPVQSLDVPLHPTIYVLVARAL